MYTFCPWSLFVFLFKNISWIYPLTVYECTKKAVKSQLLIIATTIRYSVSRSLTRVYVWCDDKIRLRTSGSAEIPSGRWRWSFAGSVALGGRHILARAQKNGVLVRRLIDRVQARSDGSALHTGQQTTAVSSPSPNQPCSRLSANINNLF